MSKSLLHSPICVSRLIGSSTLRHRRRRRARLFSTRRKRALAGIRSHDDCDKAHSARIHSKARQSDATARCRSFNQAAKRTPVCTHARAQAALIVAKEKQLGALDEKNKTVACFNLFYAKSVNTKTHSKLSINEIHAKQMSRPGK